MGDAGRRDTRPWVWRHGERSAKDLLLGNARRRGAKQDKAGGSTWSALSQRRSFVSLACWSSVGVLDCWTAGLLEC